MKFSYEPVEDFTLVASVKDYVYVGSIIKCIISLQNGNEINIERLAGQELPTIGSTIFPYWDAKDCVLLHNTDNEFYQTIENIKLA